MTLFSSTVSLYKHYINRHLTPQRASQSPPAELQCETFQTDHPDALSKCCEEFLLAPLSITEVWVVSPHTDSQSVQRATEATPTPVRAKHTSALYSVNTHTHAARYTWEPIERQIKALDSTRRRVHSEAGPVFNIRDGHEKTFISPVIWWFTASVSSLAQENSFDDRNEYIC